jgi:hypothetical protein
MVSLPSPSHTTVEACGSIGLWCSTACLYSCRTWIGAPAKAPSGSPRGFGGGLMPERFFGGS